MGPKSKIHEVVEGAEKSVPRTTAYFVTALGRLLSISNFFKNRISKYGIKMRNNQHFSRLIENLCDLFKLAKYIV